MKAITTKIITTVFLTTFFSLSAGKAEARTCTPQDTMFHILKDNNGSNEYFTENLMFSFFETGNHQIFTELVITNLGMGDGKLGIKFTYTSPDGEKLSYKMKHQNKSWKSKKRQLFMKAPGLTLKTVKKSGGAIAYHYSLDTKKFTADLTFTPVATCYVPAHGEIQYDPTHYYKNIFISPRATVKGTITIKDTKKSHNFTGLTYIELSVNTVLPHKQAKEWYRFRVLTQDYSIIFKRIKVPKGETLITKSFIFIEKGGEVLLDASGVAIHGLDNFIDKKSEKKYQVPQKIVVFTQQVQGIAKSLKMTSRNYFLDKMSFFLRSIIKQYSEPVSYNFSSEYLFILDGQTVFEGVGRAYITHVF